MKRLQGYLTAGVEHTILLIRGQKVMLDSDLATLYDISTKRLNEQVKRNSGRFPHDFMLVLTRSETSNLRSHFATSSRGWGGRRHAVRAFTEQGVAMLSSVINSEQAIQVNIGIMRAFVRLRQYLATHQDLARRLDTLQRNHETKFEIVFEAIRQLSAPPPSRRRPIGFRAPGDS